MTRVAGETDVTAICTFGADVIEEYYEPLIGATAARNQVRDWWSPDVIGRAVSDRAIIVAERAGALIGVAQVAAQADPPTVYKLYVHPAWRGRGVGSTLLDAVIRSLPSQTPRIAIEHFAANVRAASFYEREGFTVDHVEEAPSGHPERAIVWRVKKLG